MSQNKPKRQHYLPKMYLQNFTNSNNKVWVYNDKNKTIKELSIKDTTLIKNFYTIETEFGKDYTLEQELSKIETTCAPIIKKLIVGQKIDIEEKAYLSVFIATMQLRTPSSVELIKQTINPILEFSKKHLLKAGVFEDLIKESETKYGLNREQQYDLLKNSNIELTKEGEWKFLMSSVLYLANLYSQMKWIFVYTQKSSFITTDNPLFIYPAKYDTGPYGNIGIALPSVEKQIMFSPNLMLRIYDLGDKSIYYVNSFNDKKIIRNINLLQFKHRKQFVISRDKELIEFLLKRTKDEKLQINVRF